MKFTKGRSTAQIHERYVMNSTAPRASAFWSRGLVERKIGMDLKRRNEEIIRRHVEGEYHGSIAKGFGLARNSISRICRGVGRAVKSNEERNEEIRKRYANQESRASLAKAFGLHPAYIVVICKGVRKAAREKRDEEIREMFLKGTTQDAIAKIFRICPSRVSQICHGLTRDRNLKSKKRDPIKEKRNDEIKRRYANRESMASLAQAFGLHPNHIAALCKGVRKAAREKRDEDIRKRFSGGESQASIAKDLGISASRVSQICSKIKRKVRHKSGKKKSPRFQRRNEEIGRRHAEGESLEELAKEFKIKQSTVYVICKRAKEARVKKEPKK